MASEQGQVQNMTIPQIPLQPMTDPNPPTPGHEDITDGEKVAMQKAFAAESRGDIALYNIFIDLHNTFACIHAQAANDNLAMIIET